MNRICFIFLLMLTNILIGQNGTIKVKKSDPILIVVFKSSSDVCGSSAICIIGDTVQIDDCYEEKTNIFTMDRIELVKNNLLYNEIRSCTDLDLKKIEDDLNKVNNCDSVSSITIFVIDKSVVQTFSLKRFNSNCYPVSAKKLMRNLEAYFSKKP